MGSPGMSIRFAACFCNGTVALIASAEDFGTQGEIPEPQIPFRRVDQRDDGIERVANARFKHASTGRIAAGPVSDFADDSLRFTSVVIFEAVADIFAHHRDARAHLPDRLFVLWPERNDIAGAAHHDGERMQDTQNEIVCLAQDDLDSRLSALQTLFDPRPRVRSENQSGSTGRSGAARRSRNSVPDLRRLPRP